MKLIKFKSIIAASFIMAWPFYLAAQTQPATITINAATTVSSFIPISIFGNNTAVWNSNGNYFAAQPFIQAAGNYFIRYPGGSTSDIYHWNGNGTWIADASGAGGASKGFGYWAPSGTSYSSGFQCNQTYAGTTASNAGNYSNLTDGSTGTTWLSNVDTDLPYHQWAQISVGGSTINAVTIVWGNPYATTFQVQYYNGWPWSNGVMESNWSSVVTVTGTGGTQGITFGSINPQYLRILMTACSGSVTANLGTTIVSGPAYAIAEVSLYNGTTLVSAGDSAWVSSVDPSSSDNYQYSDFDFSSYMTFMNAFGANTQAVPVITVNFGTGTPSEAASWVYYSNKVAHPQYPNWAGCHYWQIGNEDEGFWEAGGPIPTQDYVRRYIEYYDAMKAVDPSIVITGPVAGGFNTPSNMYDGNGVMQDFIGILKAKGKLDHLNAIDFHWYPEGGSYSAASALASTSTLDSYPGQLNGWLSNAGVTNPNTVPVMMTEYNVDPGDENFQVQLGNGLWLADALGHFIADFGSRGYCNLWDTLNGGSGDYSTTGGDLGYLDVNYNLAPRATYWAMQMMTNNWAISGDTNAHQMVKSNCTASLLAAYADYRPDGILSLAVVNKDPTNTYNTWVTGIPFTPAGTANEWTYNSTNYQWVTTGNTPYHASPDTAPTTITLTGVTSSFPATFGPYSITVLQFVRAGAPTATPSPSPCTDGSGHTCTPTITLTPTVTLTPTISPTTTATVTNFNVLFPNPIKDNTPLSFYYNLSAPADQVKVKVFTTAFRKIYEQDRLPTTVGMHPYQLNWIQSGLNLANGLYYVVLERSSGGQETNQVMKLLIFR